MSFSLTLPHALKQNGWKVKIRDRERVEPPHVTVLRKTQVWRYGLREGKFLDKQPPPTEVPEELTNYLTTKTPDLIKQWDKMYPGNLVNSNDNDT